MAKPSKRVQKQTNPLPQEIGFLLSGLNREWPKDDLATRGLVLQLVPDVGRLARIVLKLQRLVTYPPKSLDDLVSKGVKEISEHFESERPASRHLAQLNTELSQYRTFPHISSHAGGWRFQWNVAYSGNVDVDKGGVIDARRGEELPLVLTAIRLAEQGLIDRVRRCPIDRRWFYARTKESRFCSSKCRNVFHQLDPKDKERRRKWARENYQTRKTLEAGSTKAANQRTIRNSGRKRK
jgi:hypothetical protein